MRLPPDDPRWSVIREHDVQELWDFSIAPHVAASYAARLRLLKDVLDSRLSAGGKLLDVGSAQGTLGLLLAESGWRVHLLDIRQSHIDYARARYQTGDVDFFVGAVGPSCPPDSDYDVVVCTEVIEHVGDVAAFVQACARKIRPNGLLLLTTPNADYFLTKLPSYAGASQEVIDAAEKDSADGGDHRYLFRREELIAIGRASGLRFVQHRYFLPFWVEGHAKTRYLHRMFYSLTGRILNGRYVRSTPPIFQRRLCSSQCIVFEKNSV